MNEHFYGQYFYIFINKTIDIGNVYMNMNIYSGTKKECISFFVCVCVSLINIYVRFECLPIDFNSRDSAMQRITTLSTLRLTFIPQHWPNFLQFKLNSDKKWHIFFECYLQLEEFQFQPFIFCMYRSWGVCFPSLTIALINTIWSRKTK